MRSKRQGRLHRPCRCLFISKKQKKAQKKERVGHFLGVQLALTWRRVWDVKRTFWDHLHLTPPPPPPRDKSRKF